MALQIEDVTAMKMASRQGWMGVLSLVCVAAVVLVGCGKGDSTPKGKIHGKVTLKGGALPAGCSLQLVNDDGGASAPIESGGTYALKEGTKLGTYTVVINPPEKVMSPEEAMKASMEGKATDDGGGIPAKYRNPATSDLKAEVKPGDTEYNFDLTE